MNILIDANVLLDVVVPKRGFQSIAIQSLRKLNQNGNELFLASSCLGNVVPTLKVYLQSESDAVLVFKELLEKYQIHILSTTGVDFSTIDNFTVFEEALMSNVAKRVDPDFVVLAQGVNFDSQGLKILTYQEVEESEQSKQQIGQAPLLNLSREYHQMMEEIDHALLSITTSSKFIMGPEVAEFETKCVEYIGTEHAIGTSLGTDSVFYLSEHWKFNVKTRSFSILQI